MEHGTRGLVRSLFSRKEDAQSSGNQLILQLTEGQIIQTIFTLTEAQNLSYVKKLI